MGYPADITIVDKYTAAINVLNLAIESSQEMIIPLAAF
jgi:hypothetical protein